jgi:hypothetical protein
MKLTDDIEIFDLSLYLHKRNSLVIGDVHIGFEEALNKQGILLPRFQFKDTLQRLKKIFSLLPSKKLNEIIVNGDLKHEFGTISEQEWRETLQFLDFLGGYCAKIILVKGNHDIILDPIAKKRNIAVVKDYCADNIFICHGHIIPDSTNFKKAEIVIMGNEHPAVSIREGPRSELFKCFIKGKWRDKLLIVMPSFNLVTIGTDILKEEVLSPFLKQDLSEFEVFVVGDKTYEFGTIGQLSTQH